MILVAGSTGVLVSEIVRQLREQDKNEVIKIFETTSGKPFRVEYVPVEALQRQKAATFEILGATSGTVDVSDVFFWFIRSG
jgi:hypothetical protein